MSNNTQEMEQVKHLLSQIKRMEAKYKDKNLSDSERDNARLELRAFGEQVDNFSIGFGNDMPSNMKTEALGIISDLQKLCADISNNIEESVPASHYI